MEYLSWLDKMAKSIFIFLLFNYWICEICHNLTKQLSQFFFFFFFLFLLVILGLSQASHILRWSILAEILGKSVGNCCKGDWGTRLQENPQRLGWGSWRDLLHYILGLHSKCQGLCDRSYTSVFKYYFSNTWTGLGCSGVSLCSLGVEIELSPYNYHSTVYKITNISETTMIYALLLGSKEALFILLRMSLKWFQDNQYQ